MYSLEDELRFIEDTVNLIEIDDKFVYIKPKEDRNEAEQEFVDKVEKLKRIYVDGIEFISKYLEGFSYRYFGFDGINCISNMEYDQVVIKCMGLREILLRNYDK